MTSFYDAGEGKEDPPRFVYTEAEVGIDHASRVVEHFKWKARVRENVLLATCGWIESVGMGIVVHVIGTLSCAWLMSFVAQSCSNFLGLCDLDPSLTVHLCRIGDKVS